MAGLADLAEDAHPYLGQNPEIYTAGTTWLHRCVEFSDHDGNPIDFSAPGISAVCEVVDSIESSTVVTAFTFTGYADGSFLLSVDESITAGLGDGTPRRNCYWRLTVTDSAASVAVRFWGPTGSPFVILAA